VPPLPVWPGVACQSGLVPPASLAWCRLPVWPGAGCQSDLVSAASLAWCRLPVWPGVACQSGLVTHKNCLSENAEQTSKKNHSSVL